MNIVFDTTPMRGICEVCLGTCGAQGSIQFPGTPIQIGRGCAERIVGALEPQTPNGPESGVTASGQSTIFSAICPDCGRAFARAAALASHRRVHKST